MCVYVFILFINNDKHGQALKEEEEMLLDKRQVYVEELSENEHQQKQMEICGQGLEMKLRDQGRANFLDSSEFSPGDELTNANSKKFIMLERAKCCFYKS